MIRYIRKYFFAYSKTYQDVFDQALKEACEEFSNEMERKGHMVLSKNEIDIEIEVQEQ